MSLAEAVNVMVPATVAPSGGLLIETVGGVVSSTEVAKVKSADVARFPEASLESTR